jgi:hypothetical protein
MVQTATSEAPALVQRQSSSYPDDSRGISDKISSVNNFNEKPLFYLSLILRVSLSYFLPQI